MHDTCYATNFTVEAFSQATCDYQCAGVGATPGDDCGTQPDALGAFQNGFVWKGVEVKNQFQLLKDATGSQLNITALTPLIGHSHLYIFQELSGVRTYTPKINTGINYGIKWGPNYESIIYPNF